MVTCLEQGADLHMAQLMPLPLTVSASLVKIQIGFTFLVPAHLGSPGKEPLNGCVCGRLCLLQWLLRCAALGTGCSLLQLQCPGQLSLASLQGCYIEYQLWLG